MIAQLHLSPLLPLPVLGAVAALCLLAALAALWRRARGAWWRLAAFAVLVGWLAGPSLVQETRQDLPDIALLVLDDTASMRVGDRIALRDRARRAIEAEAGRLPGLEWRTIGVPESGHEGTRLFAAIDRALADIPRTRLAGIVAVTDGQVHDAPKTPPPAPLHVLLPAAGEQVDRRLRVVEAPSYGIVGKTVTLKVAVDDLGVTGPGTARLSLRRDGEAARSRTVPVGQEQSIELPVDHAGPSVVELSTDPRPDEVSTLNNRAVVEVNGVRDRLRVLLVSGEPHAGERTWRRLLKADPAVDLVHFTILRPPDRDDMTPLSELALIPFPTRDLFVTKLRDFDLVILDRFQNRGLLPQVYLRNIAEYVRDGGALLMSVGPEFGGEESLAETPLGEVLPARPAGPDAVVNGAFRPRVTPLGERHPVTAGLPGSRPGGTPGWGDWYRRLAPADAHGQSLMSAPDGTPLLLLDRMGKGRVALLLSDQIWLWSRGHEGGGPQAELLRRVAHWLMREPDLEEDTLRARIQDDRMTIERRGVGALPETVTVTDPDGGTRPVTLRPAGPGRAAGSLDAALPGVWRVTDGPRTAYAAAMLGDPPEYADLRVSAAPLAELARASGGGVHWLLPDGVPALRRTEPDRDASGGRWIGLRRNHDHLVTGISTVPLLPAPAALALMLGLMLAAWRREGR